jgi:DMSO/TMAO reductase YedYZ molybdopterin-dependent catalytic subunit
MGFVSRGFRGRPKVEAEAGRVPPGQYVTHDFPVLSAGPTPDIPLDQWRFTLSGQVDKRVTWTWQELMALPSEDVTVDIHCVTKWTKLDTVWKGVSVDTLLKDVPTAAEFVMAHSYGGYTANLPSTT